uniref:Uncharacterized protein n=1 Tax=Arundo donax TaxID=35708 RepID=A0A0A8YKE2_ARUDO
MKELLNKVDQKCLRTFRVRFSSQLCIVSGSYLKNNTIQKHIYHTTSPQLHSEVHSKLYLV